MLLNTFLISIFFISFPYSQSFSLSTEAIPVQKEGQILEHPFIGGFNRPKIQWLDWDMDGDLDLFILDISGYLRYMENQGTPETPDFFLQSTAFQNIYCAGWFYFADFDFDSDLDLVTQNAETRDHLSYFINNGSEINYLTNILDVNGKPVISSSVMTPTFADIDNDGDLDFFTANPVGALNYYENTGTSNDLPQLEFITNSWQDILIMGNNCSPGGRTDERHGAAAITFIDLDGDGDLDLSWGDWWQQSLYIIWNSGTPEIPEMFEVTTQYPPNDPIVTAGQNMPTFADLDGDGDEDLYVTVLAGACGNQHLVNNFFYYENTGSNSDPLYQYITSNYFSTLDIFSNSSPELIDIDGDDDLDLFITNQYDPSSFPLEGHIYLYRNIGNKGQPFFIRDISLIIDDGIGQMLSPEFGDLDGDGDLDLLIGDFNGFVQYYENNSNADNIVFNFVEQVSGIDLSGYSTPALADLDGDIDLDLLIGQLNGNLVFFRNEGDQSQYMFREDEFDLIQTDSNSAPQLIDIDGDGDFDLLLGSGFGTIEVYINQGNQTIFHFEFSPDYELPHLGLNTKPALGKLFNSKKWDLISGISTGGLYHLQANIENNMTIVKNKKLPDENRVLVYPNPSNASITINFKITQADFIRLNILNLNGRVLDQINLGYQSAGNHKKTLDTQLASGIYFVQVASNNYFQQQKLVLLK